MNFKKLLIVVGFLILSIGIGFAIYWFFFRPAPPVEIPPEEVVIPGEQLPIAGEGEPTGVVPGQPTELPVTPPSPAAPIANGGLTTVTPLVSAPTVGAAMSTSGAINYWNRLDNKFYRLGKDGTPVLLSGKDFYNVKNAKFDPGGTKAIIEYPDGANVFYDFNKGQQVTLPAHWEAFDFSTGGDKIVAKSMGMDSQSRYIIVSNPDGSGAKAIQELGDNGSKVKIAWSPNNQIVATSETGPSHGFGQQDIYFIGQNNENFKSLTIPGLLFQPKWAPSGQQLMFSAATSGNDWKPQLWIVDASGNDIGKNRRSLNVSTWADKCTFSGDQTLYCAVPQELPRGAGLLPAVADNVSDDLYKIDVNTGLQTKIAVPEGDHTIGQIMIAPDSKTLYFTDKATGTLNKINLAL